jgi:hypothetical protein
LDILSEVPKKTLYHYTTQKGLLGIVKDRQIWATHHQCLNDTQEFVHAKGLFRTELEKRAHADPLLKEMQRSLEGEGFESVNLYVASFSEEPDSLAQWRAYGGLASGFSLGFKLDGIVLPSRFIMVRCIYKEDEQRERIRAIVDEILDRLHKIPGEITDTPRFAKPYLDVFFRSPLHTYALSLKHPKFAEEREWRIVSLQPMMEDSYGEAPLDFREGKSEVIPFRRVPLTNNMKAFPLTQIVVGPNPDPEQSSRSVLSLLKSQGLAKCTVRMSDVPYRSW